MATNSSMPRNRLVCRVPFSSCTPLASVFSRTPLVRACHISARPRDGDGETSLIGGVGWLAVVVAPAVCIVTGDP